jgi:hypothetical protein
MHQPLDVNVPTLPEGVPASSLCRTQNAHPYEPNHTDKPHADERHAA